MWDRIKIYESRVVSDLIYLKQFSFANISLRYSKSKTTCFHRMQKLTLPPAEKIIVAVIIDILPETSINDKHLNTPL